MRYRKTEMIKCVLTRRTIAGEGLVKVTINFFTLKYSGNLTNPPLSSSSPT